MANYFTHFSCLLDVGTPENAARALDLYNALSEENAAEDPPSEGFILSIQPEHGGTQLWMRDDETGDPEHVIQFVKRCAAAFGLARHSFMTTRVPLAFRARALSLLGGTFRLGMFIGPFVSAGSVCLSARRGSGRRS